MMDEIEEEVYDGTCQSSWARTARPATLVSALSYPIILKKELILKKEPKKEPKKTYLSQPKGKRIIMLD